MAPQTFSFSDYNCIGFDLDNTLVLYNIPEMAQLEYDLLTQFLINEKKYDSKYLGKPLAENYDFLQKGLILDINRGNILKLRENGVIDHGTHGTTKLSAESLKSIYGVDLIWDLAAEYINDFLWAWNGSASSKIRALLDCFDIVCSLVYGLAVDSMASNGSPYQYQNIWQDILEGLYRMYSKENFASNFGGYFESLKENPTRFLKPISKSTKTLLKNLKSDKVVFLLTGSALDFANFAATHALGADWQNYFDFIITYARKPGFFCENRTFKVLKDENSLNKKLFAEGSYCNLVDYLREKKNIADPKVLYIGDNLIQDIYTPAHLKLCDTLTICEELNEPPSKVWGSYLNATNGELSLWGSVISKYSKLCVPNLETISKFDTAFRYPAFSPGDSRRGFYNGI